MKTLKLFALAAFAVMAVAAFAAPPGQSGGAPGGGGVPGGMGGSFTYDSFISVATNANCLVRGGKIYGYTASLSASVAPSSGVTALAHGVFAGNTKVTTVNLANTSITEVPSDAFAGCTALQSVTLPASCTTVGANAFAGCSALQTVTASAVDTVGADAFRDCLVLTSAPTNAASIGVCAFANCPLLNVSDSGTTTGGDDTNDDDDDDDSGTTTGGDDTNDDDDDDDSGTVATSHVLTYLDDAALDASSANVFNGYVSDNGETVGTVTLKTGKANSRTGLAKFSAVVHILGSKKTTYSAKVPVDGSAPTEAVLYKGTSSMTISVGADSFSGSINGMEIVGVRNQSAAGKSRTAEYAPWAGKVFNVALSTASAEGDGASFAGGDSVICVRVLAKGKAKAMGFMADGTKFTVSGLQLLLTDDGTEVCLPVVLPMYKGKLGGTGMLLWADSTGAVDVTGIALWDATVSTKAQFTADLEFAAGSLLATPADGTWNFTVDADWSPGVLSLTAASGKFTSSDMKLTRTASTGLAKGSFTTYPSTTLKKTKCTFYAIFAGGQGYGTAILKNTATAPLAITQ